MADEIKVASTTDLDSAILDAAGPGATLTTREEAPAQPAEQDREEQQAGEHNKPKSSYQKRIDRLVKEREQERDRNRALEERLRRYESPAPEQSNGRRGTVN